MSDPFTSLRSAARALDAMRFGLDVAGQNIANVNTPGYSRRSIELAEVQPHDPWSPGGGVNVLAVTASRAPLIEARLRYEQPGAAREGTIAQHLAILEAALGQPGASLDEALSRFYNAYGALSHNPTSSVARQQVIVEGQSLARFFNEMSTRFDTARRDADTELRVEVEQVNALADQVAAINRALAAAGPLNSAGLQDQMAQALSALGDLVNINAIQRADGLFDVTIGAGRALVVGGAAYDLTLSSQPPNGFASILTDGASSTVDLTTEITGGRIAGLLQLRDALLPGYQAQLDQLAYSCAMDVNALTTSGFDLSGSAGLNFFEPPAGISGAARMLTVSAAVAADSSLVVASATPAAGNNDIARAVAALQDAAMTGGLMRPIDAWSNLVVSVATDSRRARELQSSHEQVGQQLKNLREQISGVSIDEEAAMLIKFQRAYEANAKFFQTVDDALAILMGLVRS